MGAIQFSVLSWGYHVKLFKSLGGWGENYGAQQCRVEALREG